MHGDRVSRVAFQPLSVDDGGLVIAADDPTVVHALTQTPDVAELEPTFSATDDRIFFVVDGRKGGLFELAFDPITGTVPAGATPVEIDAGLADPRMPAARRDTHGPSPLAGRTPTGTRAVLPVHGRADSCRHRRAHGSGR